MQLQKKIKMEIEKNLKNRFDLKKKDNKIMQLEKIVQSKGLKQLVVDVSVINEQIIPELDEALEMQKRESRFSEVPTIKS